MPEFTLPDPARCALLLMDFQPGIVGRIEDGEALLARTGRVLEMARGRGMRVIYVTVGFRPGYPEVHPANRSFAAARNAGRYRLDSAESDVHAALAPRVDEPRVVKHRVGAFTGTDLDMILRAQGIDTLLLCGVATSGVVLSTLRVAADLDYHCVVVADCCADADAEVHAVLTGKVFPRQATVIDAASLLATP